MRSWTGAFRAEKSRLVPATIQLRIVEKYATFTLRIIPARVHPAFGLPAVDG
jgi:hypothetical protein